MEKKYDLVIVGAGPGGAMAAKTAGENGLKTALLERKTNPAKIARGCAMMFAIESDYYFAERMYFNDEDEIWVKVYDVLRQGFQNWHHGDCA